MRSNRLSRRSTRPHCIETDMEAVPRGIAGILDRGVGSLPERGVTPFDRGVTFFERGDNGDPPMPFPPTPAVCVPSPPNVPIGKDEASFSAAPSTCGVLRMAFTLMHE